MSGTFSTIQSTCPLSSHLILPHFFLNYLFYVGVELINSAVIVSAAQQNTPAMHVYVSTLPSNSLPSSCQHNIDRVPTYIQWSISPHGLPRWLSGEKFACQAGRLETQARSLGQDDPWVRMIPGGENGKLLQYSCLENPMDRGTWQAIVHEVT